MGRAYRWRESMKEWQRQDDIRKGLKEFEREYKLAQYQSNMKLFNARILSALPAEQVRTKDGQLRLHQKFVVEDVGEPNDRYHDRLIIDSWREQDISALANAIGQIFSLEVSFSVNQSKRGAQFTNISLRRQTWMGGLINPQTEQPYQQTAPPQQYPPQQYPQPAPSYQPQPQTYQGQPAQGQGYQPLPPQQSPQTGAAQTYYSKEIAQEPYYNPYKK